MKSLLLAFLLLVLAQPVRAQTAGTCRLGSASDTLDVGDVRAALYNNGSFFWRGSDNVYTVPKDGNANSIFTANLWVGGLVEDGTHRFAGTVYGPWEYWPGPLDENGNPPDDCADYDRMYSVYDADIRAYEADGALTDDLRDWPHHLGAPVVDGDGIAGNYDLAAGDRPEIYGEQSVWWVMNDAGGGKEWSLTPPIGLEIQVQAFAPACLAFEGRQVPQASLLTAQTTYYAFTMIHKGQEPLQEVYIGWQYYASIGNPSNDYIGVDTTLHMGFQYNGTESDPGVEGYGDRPPAIGFLLTEELKVASDGRDNDIDGITDEPDEALPFNGYLVWNSDGSIQGNPTGSTIELYNYLRGLWRDGTPMTYGGTGYGGRTPTKYKFPGDPVTQRFWSEENTDGNGSRNTPSGRGGSLLSSGPFDFAPGDTTSFTLAIVWAQGQDRLDSVRLLRNRAQLALSAIDLIKTYDAYTCALPPEPEAPDPNALGYYLLRQNYPEPFSQQTTIRYEVIDTVPVQLNVYDVLGRRVRTLVDGMQEAGVYDVVFEAADLPTGTYFYRLEAAGYVSITRRMVLQR
ncbi:MAG: T9SS type A sorting domain-containing protein [Bacteroidota bacterium]